MNVLVLGAGAFAREVTGICADLGLSVIAYVVDVPAKEQILLGRPIIDVGTVVVEVPVVNGIAVRERWRILGKVFDVQSYKKLALVHPSASVDSSANVGPLSVINRQAAVGWGSVLTRGVLVNRGATVGHDGFLNDYCTIGPGAHLAGDVRVGERAFVGMGAVVREGVRIGAGATVGMGSVVLKDVPAGETWWGVPARKVER